MNPIKWISIRRNEVGKLVSAPTARQLSGECVEPMGIFIEEERQQRAGLFLRDVRYRLHAYFDFLPPDQRKGNHSANPDYWADEQEQKEMQRMDESPAKYAAMFERRAKKGQCFHRPYLGCREFACDFKLLGKDADRKEPIQETRDLGFMLYDMNFDNDASNPQAMFFRATLDRGTVNTDRRQVEVRG